MRNVCLYKEPWVNMSLDSYESDGVDQSTYTRTAGDSLKTHNCNNTISVAMDPRMDPGPEAPWQPDKGGGEKYKQNITKDWKNRREVKPWGCEEQEDRQGIWIKHKTARK